MSAADRFAITLSAIGVIGLPTLAFLARMTVMWTRTQDKLTEVAKDIEEVVSDVAADQRAMSERVTWLERHVWGGKA